VIRRLVAGGVALGVALALAGSLWVWQRLAPVDGSAGPDAEVLFHVERGDPLRAVARKLEEAGLVRDARATSWLARLRGLSGDLQAGEYRLSPADPPARILERIAGGEVATWEVVIPPGLTAREIGARLAERELVDPAAFAVAVADPELARALDVPAPELEGYLYPETYRLARGLGAEEVARILVDEFHEAWREVEPGARERGLSMHEVVTLASIVEKETGAPEERPLIASVFANRLERGMRLESDPTTIYGIPDFDGNLRRRDLEDPANPYNTYRHAGLPPGPIASPGLPALRAVVEPAESDYLFFVSRNDGTHVFSKTYREHVNAVDRYQRGGRSR